ncbi:MAG TPA: transketolase C-terminal domain-containing protein [Phycisphaerae bacterium]|nr:transketolase C-terminal domain-containing protein [Phycisphaerae bacterium]HRW54963.1 transketolase C-terminal domain-containing protein [Phycisphaerae bacterium]
MATFNRAEVIDKNFLALLANWDEPVPPRRSDLDEPLHADTHMTGRDLVEVFESQMVARHLDLIARHLRARNASFYTIGSAGHEGNALVARLTRHTDPAFLHYRSGAFFAERARAVPDIDVIYDTILSQAASSDDPIAGGRHKVWGSKPLWVIPQTSTIASHLPKAVGAAIALRREKLSHVEPPVPRDSIMICTFGDASTNHSTAQGAFNAARWAAYQQVPVPVLFVCEDNGLGISVRTPPNWVEQNFQLARAIKYFRTTGLDLLEAHDTIRTAVDYCRSHRRPTFLHLKVVRMLGHAGTDFEPAYHSLEHIAETETKDPLLQSARLAIRHGLLSPDEIRDRYEALRRRTMDAADRATKRPRLESVEEVVAPLAPCSPDKVRAEAERTLPHDERVQTFGGEDKLPENLGPRHLAVNLNSALFDLMAKYADMFVFGEDVAQKGGVYYVTAGLLKRFRASRVFNTLLDEQTILGLAQGFGYMNALPFPEIQYLAYFHNACDQLRSEACSMQFFSNDQFRNPMVVRIASLGYQKGFGGHFHNDNSITALRDIPGLVIACPSRGDDAAEMLRTCAALAHVDGRVVAFLEPIALYMQKDLYEDGDEKWQFTYPAPDKVAAIGEPRVYNPEASDVVVITYGNGVRMALRAAKQLQEEDGVNLRVVDLRWLNPLNAEAIAEHAAAGDNVVILDEGRKTGGVGEGIITAIAEHCRRMPRIRRVVGVDTYIPLGPAANLVLPCEEDVVKAVRDMIGKQ